MSHHILYDPYGLIDAELPLDREPHMSLVKAVLALKALSVALPPRDCEQIALQLTGHARAVAADLRQRCEQLPKGSEARTVTEAVLGEADRRLSVPWRGTLACAQNRARLVRALYERLDRLESALVEPATS
jgi:hypothetical protein